MTCLWIGLGVVAGVVITLIILAGIAVRVILSLWNR